MIALVVIVLAVVAIATSLVSGYLDDLDREAARYERAAADRLRRELNRGDR